MTIVHMVGNKTSKSLGRKSGRNLPIRLRCALIPKCGSLAGLHMGRGYGILGDPKMPIGAAGGSAVR